VKRISQLEEFGRIHREALSTESSCRLCGEGRIDWHHAVYRRLGGDADERNLIPLCRSCHDAVHAKRIDLLPHLTKEEQGYAASLIGIERAHRLLAPSVYKSERLR
jgi:5-methylcytosine-specific restriction endonuclease McrA